MKTFSRNAVTEAFCSFLSPGARQAFLDLPILANGVTAVRKFLNQVGKAALAQDSEIDDEIAFDAMEILDRADDHPLEFAACLSDFAKGEGD